MSNLIRYIPFDSDVEDDTPSVICLGNFDGVHIGHTALIDKAIEIRDRSRREGRLVRACALCFDMLSSNGADRCSVPSLMPLEQKLERFRKLRLDGAYVCNFADIKNYSPQRFVEQILWKRCMCIGAVCGFNFRFGKGATGSAEHLSEIFRKRFGSDTNCGIVPPVTVGDSVVSSSHIREYVMKGDMEGARAMLGRNFSITHYVVHGKHLGTSLGFPTLNHVFSEMEIIPAFGIYATKTMINGCSYESVTNVGVRPTVSSSKIVTCETHIIGLDSECADLYGYKAEICFYSKIRDEKRFESKEQLSQAIANDVNSVKKYFLEK